VKTVDEFRKLEGGRYSEDGLCIKGASRIHCNGRQITSGVILVLTSRRCHCYTNEIQDYRNEEGTESLGRTLLPPKAVSSHSGN